MKKASEKASEGKHETSDSVKRLYRGALDTIKKLDEVTKNKQFQLDVFQPSVVALRIKLKDYCERLIFSEPGCYGRKAEELLWRKVFYDVIQLIKHNRKTEQTKFCSSMDTAFRTHLVAATGYYHHLLLKLQLEFMVDLEGIIDIPVIHVQHILKPDKSSQRKTFDSKVQEWAMNACQRCLTYLGDLARYQRDFDNVRNGFGSIAQRYYYQALVLCPHLGMPHNQLGTLAGSRNYSFDASYHYLRCVMSSEGFEGAQGNLKRLFEKNRKRFAEISRTSPRNIPPEQQRAKDIKRFLVRFVYLIDVLHTESSTLESKELQDICQNTLQDFNLCMFCQALPRPKDVAEEKQHRYLDDDLVFKVATMSFLIIGKLQGTGSKQASAAIAFTLALFSHVLNHVVIRLQNALYEAKYPRNALDPGIDQLDTKEEQEVHEKPDESSKELDTTEQNNSNNQEINVKDSTEIRRTKIQQMLRRRRRRRGSNSSEGSSSGGSAASDLSEGDLSEELLSESEDMTLYAESELESNSDSEHNVEGPSQKPEVANDTVVNGSLPQTECRDLMDDNLKNMSSHFLSLGRKLPFDDDALNLKAAPVLKNGENKELKNNLMNHMDETIQQDISHSLGIESDLDSESDSEADSTLDKAEDDEKTLALMLDVMAGEGLLPTVKIFTDWLRCHPHIISTCAQSSQSLWSRLSVLLNFLPLETDVNKFEICESEEVLSVIQKAAKTMDWQQNRPLKEDVALQGIVSFRNIHKNILFVIKRRLNFTCKQEGLIRSCCLRNFGYYLSKLGVTNFTYNSERKLFIGSLQNVLSDQHAQQKLVDSETRRNQLMRDMAQLRLQAEVSQLEGSLQSSQQPSLSPYLVPDTGALCNHLNIIKPLVTSARFITIIPLTVIDQLDMLKKDIIGARDAIRYLESEFRKGNRYIRAQKRHERHSNSPRKALKMKDKEAWVFFQMLDCCKYLTQQCAEYEVANMVTLLTNYKLNSSTDSNLRMQNAIMAAQAAGIAVQNIVDFHGEWRDLSKSQG